MSTEDKKKKDEEELESLFLRAEDLTGWTLFDSSFDPKREQYKRFFRIAIEPLKERIAKLEAAIDALAVVRAEKVDTL
jgi:hypothetical protein